MNSKKSGQENQSYSNDAISILPKRQFILGVRNCNALKAETVEIDMSVIGPNLSEVEQRQLYELLQEFSLVIHTSLHQVRLPLLEMRFMWVTHQPFDNITTKFRTPGET